MLGAAGFTDPEPVEAQQHCERSVGAVVPLSGEEEDAEFRAVHAAAVDGWTRGRRTYCAGFEAVRPSMWANR